MNHHDIRSSLLRIIALLQGSSDDRQLASIELNRLQNYINATEHIFDVTSIVWSLSIASLYDPDPGEIKAIQRELLGLNLHYHTYALRYPFVNLFTLEGKQAYQHTKLMLRERMQHLTLATLTAPYSDDYERAADAMYEYQHRAVNIADLILAHLYAHLHRLPESVLTFEILDDDSHRFSTIRATSGVVDVRQELLHLEEMLHKLEGSAVLFVEVGLLPDGYVLNIR